MYSLCRNGLRAAAIPVCFAVVLSAGFPLMAGESGILRICADPDNLPFSNHAEQGFENKIAVLLARDLGSRPEFVWDANGACEVQMGIPTEAQGMETTHPYYHSTYVFVTDIRREPPIGSLNDDRLAPMRIGVSVVGDGYAPPALMLTRRGLSANITGFKLRDPRAMIEAVHRGDIDIAIAWGPFAGYFAPASEFTITPVQPEEFQGIPFTYDISVGVHDTRGDLRDRLNTSLKRQCAAIGSILDEYRVPRVLEGKPRCEPSQPESASSH